MLATLGESAFDDDAWLFEIKWDGVRAIATIPASKTVSIASRTGKDLLIQFPELRDLAKSFSGLPVIVDGEIVALDERGRSSFQRLQPRLNRRTSDPSLQASVPITFVVFDLLFAGRRDLRARPLDERKAHLERLLRERATSVLLSKHILGRGKRLFSFAKHNSLEGIIGKRRDSPYVERRSRMWVKIKAHLEQEFVIVGWTEPRGSRQEFGALLLGLYHKGKLQYAGHVGTGFNRELLKQLMRNMVPFETSACPFAEKPKSNAPVHWIRPQLVADVKFGEWTNEGILRQPVFVGLRDDKKPKDCVREVLKKRT